MVFPRSNLRRRVGVGRCVGGVVVVRSVKALSEDIIELLGDAQLAPTADWYLISRMHPWVFACIGSAGLAVGIALELLRRSLKHKWGNDLGMHVVR